MTFYLYYCSSIECQKNDWTAVHRDRCEKAMGAMHRVTRHQNNRWIRVTRDYLFSDKVFEPFCDDLRQFITECDDGVTSVRDCLIGFDFSMTSGDKMESGDKICILSPLHRGLDETLVRFPCMTRVEGAYVKFTKDEPLLKKKLVDGDIMLVIIPPRRTRMAYRVRTYCMQGADVLRDENVLGV